VVAGQLAQGRQQPSARQPLRAAAQIASWERRDHARRGVERGEQVPLARVEPVAVRGQLAVGAFAYSLEEQRVLMDPTGVGVLGEPDDVDRVGVEPDRSRDRGDQDAVAEPPDAGECGGQLAGEYVGELGEIGRRLEQVEGAEPAQRRLDCHGGVLLLGGELCELRVVAVEIGEELPRPFAELGPRRESLAGVQSLTQSGRERLQLARSGDVALKRRDPTGQGIVAYSLIGQSILDARDVRVEPGRPVVATDDRCAAGDAFPSGGGDPTAVGRPRWCFGDRAEEVGPWQVVDGEREHTEERATDRPLVDRAIAGAVDGDARGRQVLVEESRVRVGARVEDRDPMRWRRPQRLDDIAYDAAHFVVGVRGMHDLVGDRRLWSLVSVEPDPPKRAAYDPVRSGHAGECGDHRQVATGGERLGEPCLGLGQFLRQVQDQMPGVVSRRCVGIDEFGRAIQQIGAVVPGRAELAGDSPMQPNHGGC
jgi:hypothetical protein